MVRWRPSRFSWNLQVFPAEGKKLIFTQNNRTGGISFACEGIEEEACIETANKLLIPAFQGAYEKP